MKDSIAFIEKRSIPEPNSGCWLWTAYCDKDGYGICCTGSMQANTRRHIKAHRLSYATFKGPIPDGKIVCHACDTPSCVNPDHLFAGTWNDNVQDMMRKNRNRGGGKPHPGEANGNARLTVAQVEIIRAQHIRAKRSVEGSTADLAQRFGVSSSTIQRIAKCETWK